VSAGSPHPKDEVIGQYRRHADWFDKARLKTLFEKPVLDAALSAVSADVLDGLDVLDLGCGTAEPIAAYLIGAGSRVVGLDSSPEMIAHCVHRFPDMEWIVGDMRELDLGRRFHVIIAWDSFFLLCQEDQRAMFPLFAGHLLPGGTLLLSTGTEDGEAYGDVNGEKLFHASLSSAEYERQLADHGFTVVERRVQDPEIHGHTAWIARRDRESL